jgi:FAD/FMN-containing dehydrogenase
VPLLPRGVGTSQCRQTVVRAGRLEGTLAFFNEIELELQPIPAHRVLGICHFPSFYGALAATRKIVELGPSAVELVDRTMIELSRDIPMFRTIVDRFVQGEPAAILLTEFAGDDPPEKTSAAYRHSPN